MSERPDDPGAAASPATGAGASDPAAGPAGDAEGAARTERDAAPSPSPPEPAGLPVEPPPDALDAEPPAPPSPPRLGFLAERPEETIEVPRRGLRTIARRDFLLFAASTLATAMGAWWLLPDRTKARLFPGAARDRLDTLAARVGLTKERRERVLDGALTFDDDVAEVLYSKDRRVRTYARSEAREIRNNYNGRTPGPEYLAAWTLELSGLASGNVERLGIDELLRRFPRHDQVTRLVCVEGWSAIAWWGGIHFADLLAAFPPASGARWASMRSAVNLDLAGRSDPYYVSIDLETARHPQTLLATHLGGRPLQLAHGAPLRLLAPMKLGLKNIKAVTHIEYTADEPADYWNERGYSKYDGL